jgi:hypothetical protein
MNQISEGDHKQLAIWAADCAESVLPQFESQYTDDRPRKAIEAVRAWTRGERTVSEVRKLAFAAHAAARSGNSVQAKSAARAAGHAAATAHVPRHAKYAAVYAVKADRERQLVHLPEHLVQLLDIPDIVKSCML